MALKTHTNTNRAVVPLTASTHPQTNITRGSGRREVVYRDARGKTWSAVIIGPGSSSGVKLEVHGLRRQGTTHILDNIGPATAMKGAGSTGVYFSRFD